MELESLKNQLKNLALSEDDLDRTYRDFYAHEGGNKEAYLAYLVEQDLLLPQQLIDVLSVEQVEVTALNHIERHTGRLELPTALQDEPETRESDELETLFGANEHHSDEKSLLNKENLDERCDDLGSESEGILEAIDQQQNYFLLAKVGEGAMGEVHLAKDVDLRRTVAFKRLRSHLSMDKSVLEQFLNEVQITAQLEHPSVVPIYNLEVSADGSMAYSMKLVQGKTFKELIHEARQLYDQGLPTGVEYSLSHFLEHFLKVCDALDYAHSKGVIHRDLKPANIMVGAYNEVCVMDWGIARLIGKGKKEAGQIIGTPRYMSPEQAAGFNDRLDGRSDQFSLALILAELVSLRPLFTPAKDLISTVQKIINNQREPIQAYVPELDIPVELVAIIDKASARKRKDRYVSVKAFADDIRRYMRGEAVLARPDTRIQKIMRWMSLHREKTLAGIMVILFLSVSAISLSQYQRYASTLRAQEHEHQLTRALTLISARSQRVDRHFYAMQNLLETLSENTVQLLNFGQPLPEKLYLRPEFETIKTWPPDTIWSDFYQMNISTHWPVYKYSVGVSEAPLMPLLSSLKPLRFALRNVFRHSLGAEAYTRSESELDTLIQTGKTAVSWAYIGFEEGFNITYPGKAKYPDNFDIRKRPWYVQSKGKKGAHWLQPYLDAGGTGWMLPCTKPLYDKEGDFRGVAAIDMTFNYVKDNLLDLGYSGVQEVYLLNEKGQIIIRSSGDQHRSKEAQLVNTIDALPLHPNAKVIQAIQNKESGYFLEEQSGRPKLFAFYRLPSQDWYYVLEADEKKLLKDLS